MMMMIMIDDEHCTVI